MTTRIDTTDASELADMLTHIHEWLAGADHTDLARFTFLLGHHDDKALFNHHQ